MAPNLETRAVICVYCGSSPGRLPEHVQAARSLALALAANNIKLVYGGGTIGLMGEVAKTLVSLRGSSSCLGVIPEAIISYEQKDGDIEQPAHVIDESVFGELVVVPDMHTRKQRMAAEVFRGGPGSGFVALSGGYGTIEEIMEMCAWNQLGIHKVGVCLYNVGGFYDGLLRWVNKAVEEGFIHEPNKDIIVEARSAEEVVKKLQEYRVSEGQYKLNWSKFAT